jgi:hypothetical protein
MDTVIVESCHSTWVFDLTRMRFCRILKGIESHIDPSPRNGALLNESRVQPTR